MIKLLAFIAFVLTVYGIATVKWAEYVASFCTGLFC